MNLPFRFAAAAANAVLVLNDDVANLVLNGIKASALTEAQKMRFGQLAQPLGPGWLYTVDVTADKDCTITFGCYDNTAAAFYPVYPVTLLAAGDNGHNAHFNTGLAMPLGGAVVPAIQVNVAAASVILCGHIEIIPNTAETEVTPFNPGGSPVGLLLAITQ